MIEPKQICLYSAWGIGKTSALADLAHYLWTTRGEKMLVYTSDTGGGGPLQQGIDCGAIDIVYTDVYADNQFNMMDKVVQGFKPDKRLPGQPPVPLKEWKPIDFLPNGPMGPPMYGASAVEGLTSWGESIMTWAAAEHAKNRQVGQMKPDDKMNFKDGVEFKADPSGKMVEIAGTGTVYGLNTMVHYGIAQKELGKKVAQAKRLWGKGLPIIIWTALEDKVELKKDANIAWESSKPMGYGPKMPGQAATAQCGSWFTDVIHLDVVDAKKDDKTGLISGERKFFLGPHYAPGDPVPYLAKHSCNPNGKMPVVLPASFKAFFEELSAANERALVGWVKGGSGV